MNERNRPQTISETDFKRMCGEVWADSLSRLDLPVRPGATVSPEKMLLAEMLRLVRQRLGIRGEELLEGNEVSAYRNEIDALMQRFATTKFDHNRIIDRLLREVLQQLVA
ncbi:MAG: hypothetical protein ACR2H6_04625 [Pyrinomonadaceae bacterium]